MLLANYLFCLIILNGVVAQQQLVFIKTLDGETFRTDLEPSLSVNVSYIQAIDYQSNQITYTLNSTNFYVDKYSGQVFLVSRLVSDGLNTPNNFKAVTISASNSLVTIAQTNTISIINANNRPPEFASSQRVFEIEEDNPFPVDLKFRNGSLYEIQIHDPDLTNNDLALSCESTVNFPDVCNIFGFAKNVAKSTVADWFGTLRAFKKLNYLDRSIYQLVAVARKNFNIYQRAVFEIRVLPNLSKPPQLSSSSLVFSIFENQPPNTIIGQLKLADEYDLSLRSMVSSSVIYNSQELLNNGINNVSDINFDLVKTYIQSTPQNQLQTLATIYRDSNEFTNLDGVLRLWAKVYYNTNPNNANYYKITIIIMDVNDNEPKLGTISAYNPINSYSKLGDDQIMSATINENEIGPILLASLNNYQSASNYLVAYDQDLAENATFELNFLEPLDASILSYPINEFSRHVSLNPNINSQCGSVLTNTYLIQSKTSINMVNRVPFDFDDLKITPNIDPNTGIANKVIKFGLSARETLSKQLFSSNYVTATLTIQDLNDNKPVFTQDTFYVSIAKVSNYLSPTSQSIIKYEIQDKDSGVYGLSGLKCFLMGDGSEKFIINENQQKIFLKPCQLSDCSSEFKPNYYLTLICKDNLGNGQVAFATIIISFQNIYKSGFIIPNKAYYVLATGPDLNEIPYLVLKGLNLDPTNKLTYTVQDPMSSLFTVDSNGVFRVTASKLTKDPPSVNNAYLVNVLISDNEGNKNFVSVIVQLSDLSTKIKCPKISDSAICNFAINQSGFDPNIIRFCFYGANPIATSYNTNPNSFYNQILYSLLADSPYYLYINPLDGCVKILPSFNLKDNNLKYIKYSVGVFNPGYPECIGISQRQCTIKIDDAKYEQIRCSNKFSISENRTYYKLLASSSDPTAILKYSIIREERLNADGSYQIMPNNFLYQINSQDGSIQLYQTVPPIYISVMVVVQIQDLSLLSNPTNCFVDFRFDVAASCKLPHFIGNNKRTESLCEDLPADTRIMTLNSFDPSLSGKPLCYSLVSNDYFKLSSNQDPSPNGDVSLKKAIDYKSIQMNNPSGSVNFTALLYYCNQPSILSKQTVTVNLLTVNKYGPILFSMVPSTTISLAPGSSFMTPSLNVLDDDSFPYDLFTCSVENDNNFIVINNFQQKTISIKYLNPTNLQQNYIPYADLAIKCCDDQTSWTRNDCFSNPKCTISQLRVEFTDFSLPIYCANDKQISYISENTQVSSQVSYVYCISNYTKQPITYQLLTNTNSFSVNPNNGFIFLNKPLANSDLKSETIQIQCSNGIQTTVCQADLRVIPTADYRPVWVFPNPNTLDCVCLKENMAVNSLIIQVRATIANNWPISYSFVYEGLFTNSVYEFYINTTTGMITLNKPLSLSVATLRELTLAATAKRPFDLYSITTYQYLCIKTLPIETYQPCFRSAPDGKIINYEINLFQTPNGNMINDICYYDQKASVYNLDSSTKAFYYLIPNKTYDDFFSYFTMNKFTGLLCNQKSITNDALIGALLKSPNKYVDSSNNICYNLVVLASFRQTISNDELKWINYNSQNCSFNYFKVCLNKFNCNSNPIALDKRNTCEAVISLDNFSPLEGLCINQFRFLSPPENRNSYDYEIFPINNNLDTKTFYMNKSIDCLSLKFENGFESGSFYTQNKNNYIKSGLHLMNVTVFDKCQRTDSLLCYIYLSHSCNQRSFIYTGFELDKVLLNKLNFINFLSKIASAYFTRNVNAVYHGAYIAPTNAVNQDEFKETNSIIVVSFYDNINSRFLSSDNVTYGLNSYLNTNDAKLLEINQIVSSCPSILPESDYIPSIGVGIWSLLLLLMLLLLPLLMICLLCYAYKKLKYQNNQIIMKEKIIPIIQECDEPPIFPLANIPSCSNIKRGASAQSHPVIIEDPCDEAIHEIIEEPIQTHNHKKIVYKSEIVQFKVKPPHESTYFMDENTLKPAVNNIIKPIDYGYNKRELQLEPKLDRFQKYQLYGTEAVKNESNERRNSYINSIIQENNYDLEPVGETSIVSFNSGTNGFIYDDSKSLDQASLGVVKSEKRKKKKRKNSKENLI